MGMENGAPVETLDDLAHFMDRGVGYITLTHSENNRICDSSFASDRTFLSTALRPLGIPPGSRGYMGASLDHAMWFHHPPRFDDWILYCSETPAAQAARALINGAMFTPDGVQLASVSQEALIRRRRDD